MSQESHVPGHVFIRSHLRVFMSSCFLALMYGFASTAALHGQNTIRGRVHDENNAPVPNIQVLLHRVTTTAGGSTVDADTSNTDGTFTLVAPPETDSSA